MQTNDSDSSSDANSPDFHNTTIETDPTGAVCRPRTRRPLWPRAAAPRRRPKCGTGAYSTRAGPLPSPALMASNWSSRVMEDPRGDELLESQIQVRQRRLEIGEDSGDLRRAASPGFGWGSFCEERISCMGGHPRFLERISTFTSVPDSFTSQLLRYYLHILRLIGCQPERPLAP
jgi:hypothetical protein